MDIAELERALDNSCIDIDTFSGKCQLKFPLGELLGQLNGMPLQLALTAQVHASSKVPVLNFFGLGTWKMSGGSSYEKYAIHVSDVPLVNGQAMSISTDDKSSSTAVGPGYIFDATHILNMRKDKFGNTVDDFQRKPLKGQTFTVMHTSGMAEIFDCVGDLTKDTSEPPLVLTRKILESNGKGLTFTWQRKNKDARVTSIQDSTGTVLKAEWDWSDSQAPKLSQLILHPDTTEAVTYDCAYEEKALVISLTKQHPFLEKMVYRLETGKDHMKLKSTTHYKSEQTDKTKEAIAFNRQLTETLKWENDKIKTLTIEMPGSTARLTKTWTWKEKTTQITLTSEQTLPVKSDKKDAKPAVKTHAETLQDVTYTYSDGVITKLESKALGSTSVHTCTVTTDAEAHTTTSCIVNTVDGVEVSKTESTFNQQGNIIELKRGDEKIQWTYFNNYTHYHTTSEITNDASQIQNFLWDAIIGSSSPIGAQFKNELNFASNTVRKFTTFKSSAPNNYAKSAFNLPLDINYPGDELGFSNHVESERVIKINKAGETTAKITYFGYDKIATVKDELIDRNHVVVLARKLTVLMPTVSSISVTKEQRAIADKAIESMVAALKACIESVKDDDYLKGGYEKSMAAIKGAAKTQSEMNDKGFKLDNWKNVQMTVEDFTYDTSPDSAHFCQLTSNKVYALDEAGTKIENSEVDTALGYNVEDKDARKITTNTVVTSSGATLKTTCVHEGAARMPVEQTDASGITTTYTYANGALSASTMQQDKTVLSASTVGYTVDAEQRTIQIEVKDSKGLNTRSVHDERGRVLSQWTNMDGEETAWRKSSETAYSEAGGTTTRYIYDATGAEHEYTVEHFDRYGETTRLIEYDYDAKGGVFDVRTTEWKTTPTDTTKTVSVKDGKGTVLDTRSQTKKHEGSKLEIKRGTFSETYQWDASKRTATYTQGTEGAAETLQLTIGYDAQGRPIQTKYQKQQGKEKEKKVVDISLHTTEYNVHGLPITITADSTPPLTMKYDALGRLTKKEKDGATLHYDYEKHSASPAPLSIKVSEAAPADKTQDEVAPTTLGEQELDAWGRVVKQTVNKVAKSFTYTGASPMPHRDSPSMSNPFKGYTQTWNDDDRTYTEACAYGVEASATGSPTLSTQTALSLRGRIIEFTDIAGQTTRYTYDAFDRVIKQVSPVCITTAAFSDDGRLQSETVLDVVSQRVMTISYLYDVLGREIERQFTSKDMQPITLKRELSSAGRLTKHSCIINGKSKYTHDYKYNALGQLIDWDGNGRGVKLNSTTIYKEAYGYDAVGNMTTYGFAKDKESSPTGENQANWVNHPRTYSSTVPGLFTKARNSKVASESGRITRNISYSEDGRVDHLRWLVSYSDKSPDLHFTYDNAGRVRALFTSGGNDSPRGYQLHYRGNTVYARSQKTNNGGFWNGTLERTDILLNESVGCTLRQTISKGGKASTRIRFELRDASNTIFATVKPDGKLDALHDYTPYGYTHVDNEWEHWLGFKGEVIYPRDFYYLGNYRAYDPDTMTFCSPDDASPFGIGGPATYAFCAGDPINYHDPSGHARVSHLSAVVAPPIMTTREFRIAVAVGSILTAPIGGGALATTLGVVSGGLELASVLVEDSDPQLASTLNVLSFGTGLGSVAAGLSGASRLTGAASRSLVGTRTVADKTMAGVSGYRYIDDQLRLFEDTHKGAKRLVVELHGAADDTGKALGKVVTSEGDLDAREFMQYLSKKGVNFDDYDKIKMHTCYSASHYNNFGDSFGKDLARATKKEVKGYQGPMNLSGQLGDRQGQMIDDPKIYQLLGSEAGQAELLEYWRPRKVDWKRDLNGLPILDSNGAWVLRPYEKFKPVTFKPRPDSWQIDEILGDHSHEKMLKRYHKNRSIYSDPKKEHDYHQMKLDGTLLEHLLDGDSLC
ncbi:RHS repeat-associated core domain-containing protein [Pseudomonas fulva]|uniref:RHS repeat-associated core domain-containing protein n=1 Tax=Pseudomonas fulva TaxID=47880 RepID=UPI0018A8F012|nr:RHS repeat-associated core domain-containing protein [Pseudomonas fulva]MBF8774199.1 RHS repeat-associated core domain-containing protein [Pseudomonas fulva]